MIQVRLCRFSGFLRLLGVLLVVCQVMVTDPVRSDIVKNAGANIFVASNGWHSAIFVPRAAVQAGVIPETADIPEAAFWGFGWGDAAYFPDRDAGLASLLSAALRPTPSVIHVTGLSSDPRTVFPTDEVLEVAISAEGTGKLLAFLNASFSRGGASRAAIYAPGLHSFSKFYRATGEFHLFNNCNRWTARALAAAGVPIEADGVIRAEELMDALRAIAEQKRRPRPIR